MNPQPEDPDPPLRFGRFELRPREYRLLADGQPVPLGGRAMDLLLALAARSGELLTRNELIEQVWPGRVVEDNNLSVQIKALRKALGEEWLVTVPGRGYRLDLPRPAALAGVPAPPPAPAPLGSLQLPATALPLIGRDAELAALQALLSRHGLVTIVGAGGIGKTRLAQAALHADAGRHADGVCWVELGPVTTPAALPAAVAAALGLPGSAADPVGQLARTLGRLQMLLALDNAEHLLDAVATLAHALLGACSGLRLLVTSQAPLQLATEHVLRLGPLAVPPAELPAREARGFGAVAMFCDRATAADHRFVLRDAEVPAVVGLCHGLNGSPLGIELAAARVATLGVDALLDALSERPQLLSGPRHRHAPARQRSLRAALEWSVGLLPPAAAELFCRLGVVVGSASLALVQRLGAAEPASWDVVDALDELVQRSLVELVQDEAHAQVPVRYRLLELPRTLALEMLAARGEEAAVRQRHAQGVLADYDTWRAALRIGPLGQRAIDRLRELNLGNARAALGHARSRGDRELELALASAAMPAALSEERLTLAERCTTLMDEAEAGTAAPLAPLLRLRAQRAIASALTNLQPARSEAAARKAVDIARAIDDPQADRFELYDALCALAQKLTDEGDGQESGQLLREALALENPLWPIAQRRVALNTRASLAMNRGEVRSALPLYRHLLEGELAAGETGHEPLLNLANAELVAGDAAAAVVSGRRLVAGLAGWRNESLLHHASANLMLALLALGEVAPARAIAEQLWGGARRARLHAWFIDGLALLAAQEGRAADAAALALAADARYRAAADRRELNEQRAHDHTMTLLAQAGCALPAPPQAPPSDAELIALALALARPGIQQAAAPG